MRLEGDRLKVEVTPQWREKLHAVRAESWLLAGEGLLRAALRIEIV